MKFELTGATKTYSVLYKGKEYSITYEDDLITGGQSIYVYDEDGEDTSIPIREKIIQAYETKDK